jgi:flavin-binding protein dodecin
MKETDMSVAKITEISASSGKSFDDAIRKGLARAAKTLDGIEGAWIHEQKVVLKDGRITQYRVNMKITFILRDK